jgi:hypothetical protein
LTCPSSLSDIAPFLEPSHSAEQVLAVSGARACVTMFVTPVTESLSQRLPTHTLLDADLARIYGVATKALNQAVKRNNEKSNDFIG